MAICLESPAYSSSSCTLDSLAHQHSHRSLCFIVGMGHPNVFQKKQLNFHHMGLVSGKSCFSFGLYVDSLRRQWIVSCTSCYWKRFLRSQNPAAFIGFTQKYLVASANSALLCLNWLFALYRLFGLSQAIFLALPVLLSIVCFRFYTLHPHS